MLRDGTGPENGGRGPGHAAGREPPRERKPAAPAGVFRGGLGTRRGRLAFAGLLTGALVGAGLLAALYEPAPSGPRPAGAGDASPWLRWQALSAEERGRYVRLHEAIAARDDSLEVLARARRFAALPAAVQDRLRMLYVIMTETVNRQDAANRRFLHSLPSQARALWVYRKIEQDEPERLRALAAERFRNDGGGE